MDTDKKPFTKPEQVTYPCVLATYEAKAPKNADILRRVANFAVGQTIGTWIPVPGITEEMINAYQGSVLSVNVLAEEGPDVRYSTTIAFPTANFGGSMTQLMTALVGNDVSTAMRSRLVKLSVLNGGEADFSAPKQGIDQLRKLTGVYDRPLVLNMIKPCAGYTPEEGAKLFREVALGGVDLVKDDELLGSPVYNHVADRTRLYTRVAREVYEQTGHHTLYVPNISGRPSQLLDNARRVMDAGAKACLVNYVFGGLDALLELNETFGDELFILAHYAGLSVMESGLSNGVFLGTLARLAGAHAVMTMCPDPADRAAMADFENTVAMQQVPCGTLSPVLTTVGGGITPINQQWIQKALGNDAIIGIGGAIQGHPMGATAGAQAAMAAVAAAAAGISLEVAAQDCLPLEKAIELWR
ncbi:RuBisCO large subunit C-terminal-like domain-containing protein [bacterium]|nr:RuBisCO large subunit C-terminal-like domain-containing protein [bacterium]